jgi:hypothetical protein
MEIKKENLVKEIKIIQGMTKYVFEGIEQERPEWALRHMYMITSRLGTLHVLLDEAVEVLPKEGK